LLFLKTFCFKFVVFSEFYKQKQGLKMEKWLNKEKLKSYLTLNWFKLMIFVLIAFIFLRKDFSFSINLNSPFRMEEEQKNPSNQAATKKEPLVTEKQSKVPVVKSQSSFFDRFELPFIGKGKTSSKKEEIKSVSEESIQAYINRFANVAVNEQQKFGIPASIILGNALVHSFAGKRDMAIQGNNHFSIPCTPEWKGDSGTYNDACYRHYENAWTSFRDNSIFLSGARFGSLRKLRPTDYKSWATGLEKLGYSDLDNLEKRLLEVIDTYQLHQLDAAG